jgi:guanylate kinase
MMTMTNKMDNRLSKGLLIVLSGPSGVGKGTVCNALRGKMDNLVYSVSATTRNPRLGEENEVNYFFKTQDQFRDMIEQGQLLEYAEYVGNYYGTPRDFVEQTIQSGKDIILEIEVQGALKVKENFPDGIFIFLLPPSLGELEDRIRGRGTENQATIDHRLSIALNEIDLIKHYDYVVVNDEIDHACKRIESIVIAEHCKVRNTVD